jgi:hypothetical protein
MNKFHALEISSDEESDDEEHKSNIEADLSNSLFELSLNE